MIGGIDKGIDEVTVRYSWVDFVVRTGRSTVWHATVSAYSGCVDVASVHWVHRPLYLTPCVQWQVCLLCLCSRTVQGWLIALVHV